MCQAHTSLLCWVPLKKQINEFFQINVLMLDNGCVCFSCAANITFWTQKTADILNYPQRQGATQKRAMHTFISLACVASRFPFGFGEKKVDQ